MARQLTPPVTVVKGDEAPDLYITLQQDSTGSAYNLTNRAAFAVIVESGQAPEAYIEKFPIEIVDAAAGQLKLSWVRSLLDRTSYLDYLDPSKRYTVQIFLGSINYPPVNITCVSDPEDYFGGTFYYTGEEQEGSPVYKHTTEYGDEVFLSRSPYTPTPGNFVWVVTALQAETWDNVKDQPKATLFEEDLADTPIWNFTQEIQAANQADFTVAPILNTPFTPAPDYIIAPEYAGGKVATTTEAFQATAVEDAPVESSGTQTVITLIPLVVRAAYRLSE